MSELWYNYSTEQAFNKLQSSYEGLPDAEAEHRFHQHGPNELVEKKKKSRLSIFLNQFKDVMILILMSAAIISGVVGDLKDAIVIAIIILINAIVGFIQEYRAEKAMDALKKMSASEAKVKRNGQLLHLPVRQLVPGDLVLLEAGDIVPADLRLLETHALKVEEASLTGESYPVEKNNHAIDEGAVPLGDRFNMVYKSTLVTYGRGEGLVVATGMQTEIGSIAKMLQGAESMTPLQKRLREFSKKLSVIVLAICVVLLLTGILRGEKFVDMLLVAISLAVAAIPEALPAVITISLALGARKLVRKNALIRKLPAVETLGSVTFICTDKTGTLTQNKMTVKAAWHHPDIQVPGFDPESFLLFCMVKNQDTKNEQDGKITGDPTEVALYEYGIQQERFRKEWLSGYERIEEMPFDSDRKMMSTVHRMGNGYLVVTKGAMEAVLERCHQVDREELNRLSADMAAKGLRVLAYGYKILDHEPSQLSMQELESGLLFAGFAGMIDPPREEAKQAVTECVQAGIVPVMITGDHPVTAKAIAGEIGILQSPKDQVITGAELAALDDESFENRIEKIRVYARVNPEQKLQIVKTLQKKGQYVSMTGDGVNDAPALKQANIGVAMGITGTDVSKEAAHMILLDDNFATIIKAVKEGRRIFDNIRKFIRYIMTGNSSEIWTILLAPLVGLPIPLLPIHILWINLVTDGLPALALANEPAEKNIMQRPPRRPDESIFAGGLGIHVLWVGLLMGALCLGVQAWAINAGSGAWQTLVFSALCFAQMAHVLAIRSETTFFFKQGLFSNTLLIGAVLMTTILQLAIIYIPVFNEIFSTQPLTIKELLICIGVGVVVFHAVELEKFIRSRNKNQITVKSKP
jgi:P-type Ca2+ transporter type 2C